MKYADELDDDIDRDYCEPWCRDFGAHRNAGAHDFCIDHQAFWCRLCGGQCPECVEDPHCRWCHCALNEDYHDWDCPNAD